MEYVILIGAVAAASTGSLLVFGGDLKASFSHYSAALSGKEGSASPPVLASDEKGSEQDKQEAEPDKDDPDKNGPDRDDPDRGDPDREDPDKEDPNRGDPHDDGREPPPEIPSCSFGSALPAPPRYVDGDIVLLEFTGNQIGRYSSMWGHGNQKKRLVYVNEIEPLGSSSEIFTLRVWQTHGNTEIKNGMLADILDASGAVLAGNANPRPDEEQRLATGDEHMILTSARMVIDLHGLEPGDAIYGFENEVGDPDWGDNDGEFDFDQTGCPQK